MGFCLFEGDFPVFLYIQQRLERALHCRAGIGDHCIYRNAVVVEDWVGLQEFAFFIGAILELARSILGLKL